MLEFNLPKRYALPSFIGRSGLFPVAILIGGWLASQALPAQAAAASDDLRDGHSVIVVAHNDDQVLFFDAVLTQNPWVILAGPADGYSRWYGSVDIFSSYNDPYGYKASTYSPLFTTIPDEQWLYNARDNKCHRDLDLYGYDATYNALLQKLKNLRDYNGVTRIITHNPWGEYGHPNHRNVAAAARNAGINLGMDVWMDSVAHPGDQAGGTYYEADWLPAHYVTYYYNYGSAYISARARYANTIITIGTWSDDLWTWPMESPSTTSHFFKVVDGGGATETQRNLLLKADGSYSNLYHAIMQIRGEEIFQYADPHSAQVVRLTYTCSPATNDDITQIYVAGFKRAPELDGFNYWFKKTNTAEQFATDIFNLPSVKAIYPDSLSDSGFVTAIYNSVFGRSPDAAGLNYWLGELSHTTRGNLVLTMVRAGLVPSMLRSEGKDYLANRLNVALYALTQQQAHGVSLNPNDLELIESSVNASPYSVNPAKAAIDALF